MKRIDLIFKKLIELSPDEGIDANKLADILNLSRANVSSDLNKLYKQGKVKKSSGRPVLFSPVSSSKLNEISTTLDRLAKENKSLTQAVEQAKAAILYPPKGMHTIIIGETGVGKTMFAAMMHKYAIEMEKMPEDAPFITFNCADYSNNPQLLLSQLFGVKKGAYTGADFDKKGLIEKADKGILFLDEVHRLPAEGQEMFFTFIDKGTFRRLGETDIERSADVLIISATTENPESALLKTFIRRIPVIIRIPKLCERGTDERYNLIVKFLKEESVRLNREIKVSANSIRAFLNYDCPNNIGQLKTDIQLACAKSYADFLTNKKNEIKINSSDLPEYVREGLYKDNERCSISNKYIGVNSKYISFNKDQGEPESVIKNDEESIYEIIDSRISELKTKGISGETLDKIMQEDIKSYFAQFIDKAAKNVNRANLQNIVESSVIKLANRIIDYSEEKLKIKLGHKLYTGLALHIKASVERIKRNNTIINPQLNRIRTEFRNEFSVALDCLKMIEDEFDINMPIDEAGYLAMFFVPDIDTEKNADENVGVLIIAHGTSTATSIAEVANTLLDTNLALGINAPLDKSPQEILELVRECIKCRIKRSGYIFLVDMGSLTTFGEIIEKEFKMPVKVVPLVSTIHAIESVRKAVLGSSLDEIYNDVKNIANYYENDYIPEYANENSSKFVILAVCMTGEGTAIAIKNFLQGHLKMDQSIFEIIPINLIGKEDINLRIKKISKEKKILCIISQSKIKTQIPVFNIEDVLNLKAIPKIQYFIDVENTYFKMGKTLKQHLKNVDGEQVFDDVRGLISNIENSLKIKLDSDTLIGVIFHISCMIDRLKANEQVLEFEGKKDFILENYRLYERIKNELLFLNKKYDIEIDDNEICYIMNFIKKIQ